MTQPVVIEIVGSLNMDLVTRTARMPEAGETLQASGFSAGYGGKGANQAVACARLLRSSSGSAARNGIQVKMHGAVGSGDSLGSANYIEYLQKEGIDTSGIRSKEGVATGTAVIIVEEHNGENRILISPGANGKLNADDVLLDSAPGGFVMFQLEIPLETTIACISKAKRLGKTVLLNAAPASKLSDEVFEGLHHLHVNEGEAAALSGISADEIESKLPEVAEYFQGRGVKNVVVTMGEKGIYFRSQKQEGRIPIIRCKAVDTTAAGDTFAAGYISFLALHDSEDIEGALHFANRAAGLSVQRHGAQASMPFLSELEDAWIVGGIARGHWK